MTATSFLHWVELLAKLAAMAAAYYVVGRLGLLLAIPPGYATAVWPASGIALAGVLYCSDTESGRAFYSDRF